MIDADDSSRKATEGHPHDPHRRGRWVWWLFAAMALFYLLAEHRAHLFGVLPYLLVLACPLMHRFMHGHHGHRHGQKTDSQGGHHEQP